MFNRRKDGSLNLSIQAIVILVMAMAVLGLGLGFIRTLIGQGQSQFETAIENAQLENPASADNPVTVDNTVSLKSGESAKMSIGFYNTGTSPFIATPSLDENCESMLDLVSGVQTVPSGEARGYRATLTINPNQGTDSPAPGSTLVCTINFGEEGSEQFFVDIIS